MDDWPALPFDDWRDTRDTLHMCTQIVGKLRLALSPFEPQWANVPLYVTARGLTTSPVPDGLRTFDVEFDLVDHRLVVRASDGSIEQLPLRPRAVADFFADLMGALDRLGIDVTISPGPSEVADPIPFAEDRVHHSYEPADARRFFHVLSQADVVLKEHRSRFNGKAPPVEFFWGSFDLVGIRFSGRPATPPPGADTITRYGGDAEQICGGFWPGQDAFPAAAFFAYGYPKPDGIEQASIAPEGAGWNPDIGEFVFPYDAMRMAPDPRRALLDFLESTYDACAQRLGWSPDFIRTEEP
ncbi:MAG TPA: DUF5996 family protein [Acidimicrobiia bacterium]|nr:DUF5996 family protein [Acidimicrobiia bacterium]